MSANGQTRYNPSRRSNVSWLTRPDSVTDLDQHAIQVLEYQKVLAALASHAATDAGRELAISLTPVTDFSKVSKCQEETAQARRLLSEFGGIPFGGVTDIRPHLEKSLLAASLHGKELLDVAQTATAGDRARLFLVKHAELAPDLAQLASIIVPQPDLVRVIESAIDNEGQVRDSASDKLARVRREMRTVAGRIQDKLNSIIQSSSTRLALQDAVVVSRQGRWCVPVRSDSKSAVPGIVHDASASGATLFVEPQAVVELGNKLRELEAVETEEVERVLRELTHKVAQQADLLQGMVQTLAELDLANAKAVYSDESRCTRPVLSPKPFLDVKKARNPLLPGDVIPVDLRLGLDFMGLLITGPNTGGKTVTLKTAGLLVLMCQSGLQIPAEEGSRMGVFNGVFADIGDEQSIEQSLSTFSGHVRNIVHTIQNVSPGCLVLFDELGAGTDPAEGAALATSLLNWLKDQGALIIATTHYGELKSFAFLSGQFENASVEFNRETLKPTYKLLIGIPGASHALHIAQRLGMPADIIDDARGRISSDSHSATELIRRVEESRLRALEEEKKAEKMRQDAEKLTRQYKQDLDRLTKTRAELRESLEMEARKTIQDTRQELEKVLRELRTQKKHSQHTEGLAGKAKRLQKKLETSVQKIDPQPEPVREVKSRPMRKGDTVRLIGVGTTGTLMEEPTGETGSVQVQFGAITTRVDISELELTGSTAKQSRKPSEVSSLQTRVASQISPEIMLRGQRVEDAMLELDKYVDEALLAGLEKIRVIHGKGTGVMRKACWSFLRKHPHVKSLEMAGPSDGGEGATIAILK